MDTFIPQLKRRLAALHVGVMCTMLGVIIALGALGTASLAQAGSQPPAATPATGEDFQPDPFPATPEMTTTVQLVLDQYVGLQPFAPPVAEEPELTPFISQSQIHVPFAERAATGTPPPPPPPPPVRRADIALTLWPEPSIYVMRGARLTYELRIANHDQGDAKHVRVLLPYDRQQLRLVATRLDRAKGDWVSRVTDREIEVIFGAVNGKEARTGLLVFEVAATLRNDTILDMRANYNWWDDDSDYGPYPSNWAPVLVGNGPATAPWVWTQVTPTAGPAGTTHTFLSNRFAPGEGIITWLNTPTGVRALDLRGVADSQGAVTLAFSSAGLQPGTYQLVLYGARSKLTGVASFTVR